ncbi:prephenate dehydratase [Thermodesulfobacteriota bacterium]
MTKGKDSDVETDALRKSQEEINGIDGDIISLLSKRQGLASEMGRIKQKLGVEMVDTAKEQDDLKRLLLNKDKNLSADAIRTIFTEIISAERSVQKVPSIAFLGPEATFSHQSAVSLYGNSATFRATEAIEDVFDLVEKDVCDLGVVPIENSYEGTVNITLDLFYKYDLKISAENFVRIRHHFLSKSQKIQDVKQLYIHPMTRGQCRSWIKTNLHGIPITEVASNSLAAKMAAENGNTAGVGSRFCSQIYDLNILEEDIEDHPDNITRFLVIGKGGTEPTGQDKTSLMFFLHHRPGALYKVLRVLADKQVNMTRIESRPVKIKNWEYLFFVDIEGHEKDADVAEALMDMEEHCVFMKMLGSYPSGGEPWD